MREQINSQIKEAMKAKDSKRLMTLRLITAAIKDYDIAVRSDGNYDGATDQQVLQILAKMIKQRKESATQYANANRPELEAQELMEITVIEAFLPKQMSDGEIRAAVKQAIETLNAESIRDMGRVMAELKEKHATTMDFAVAGALVKKQLG